MVRHGIWLPREETAKHLKIGRATVSRLARDSHLPAHRMGRVWRFDAEELDAWLKSSELALSEKKEL